MQVLFLELFKKLLSKLGHLWLNHNPAIGLVRIMKKVILVKLFGRIKSFELRDLGYDRCIPDFYHLNLCNHFFSNFLAPVFTGAQ